MPNPDTNIHSWTVKLDPDDPAKRASVLQRLVKAGADDLVEMLGVKTPIPFYGEKA